MTETPSQLHHLVHNLYQTMEQGLLSAWQEKLQDPQFLNTLSESISLEEDIQQICKNILQEESAKEELQSIVQIITIMQEQIERNANELDEKASEIERYEALIDTMAKRVENLEKEILHYRIEASETRLSSMERCEELQKQINELKR